MIEELFEGVYRIDSEIATLNLTPGVRVYGEKLVRREGREYRLWNPYRSKLAAAIMLGLKQLPLSRSTRVLYLGAAQGTTASHVSDIAREGVVYCVELSPRAMQSLLRVAEARENLIPILANAAKPESYCYLLEKVDLVYQDIAQAEQTEILLKNLRAYLKKNGHFVHLIKARSIDVTAEPEEVFKRELEKLTRAGARVLQALRLEPYEKDHLLVLGRFSGATPHTQDR
ncbi:MAG: fibrillarin-like rRNA/tRNA 2'-O-methyltransferase [Euryarchaeota archaeon]|nr:fibrillarin-like rRNA/tRNA 2'-O-methyltransferase [Euryarchaeota archaeon]